MRTFALALACFGASRGCQARESAYDAFQHAFAEIQSRAAVDDLKELESPSSKLDRLRRLAMLLLGFKPGSPPLTDHSLSPCLLPRCERTSIQLGEGEAADSVRAAEDLLLSSLGRDRQVRRGAENTLGAALDVLEQDGGVDAPVDSKLISGDWELVYTSKSDFSLAAALGSRVDGSAPGLESFFRQIFGGGGVSEASSSPIQRTVTAIEGVTVLQNIRLTGADPRVDQIVKAGDIGMLRLSAGASTPDLSRRRIDFAFDLGYATLNALPDLKIPYPVPFKLLGDEAKGWLDTTYLSERLRVCRGNKGTTFILRRVQD